MTVTEENTKESPSEMAETTKGAATTESYFLKQEIVQHFDGYVKDLQFATDEDVDLTHNNPNNEFHRRKKQFEKMKVYNLLLKRVDYKGNEIAIDYQVKLGLFKKDRTLNLYAITDKLRSTAIIYKKNNH